MKKEIWIDQIGIPCMNQVLIEIEDIYSSFKTKSGLIIKSNYHEDSTADSIGHSVSDFIPRKGKVIALPKYITNYKYDYDTTCELQNGDDVFWTPNSSSEQTVLFCSVFKKKYVLVDYHEIIIRERNGKLMPINGFILLSPVGKEEIALQYKKTSKISDLWDIKLLPETFPVSETETRNGEFIFEAGDRVKILTSMFPYRIEQEMNRKLDEDLFACYWWMVLCDIEK